LESEAEDREVIMNWIFWKTLTKGRIMALTDKITADQQAVAAAQAALDAANAALKDDQDKLASLDALEAAANAVPHAGVKQQFLELVASTKNA
jgi:hypothetical protein